MRASPAPYARGRRRVSAKTAYLDFQYTARGDKPTPVNLTQHGYWNLAGAGTVRNHRPG